MDGDNQPGQLAQAADGADESQVRGSPQGAGLHRELICALLSTSIVGLNVWGRHMPVHGHGMAWCGPGPAHNTRIDMSIHRYVDK